MDAQTRATLVARVNMAMQDATNDNPLFRNGTDHISTVEGKEILCISYKFSNLPDHIDLKRLTQALNKVDNLEWSAGIHHDHSVLHISGTVDGQRVNIALSLEPEAKPQRKIVRS